MKYTNVSTRFHNITEENKIKHRNFQHKINCGLIHFFFSWKWEKQKFTLNPQKNLLTITVDFQNFHKLFSVKLKPVYLTCTCCIILHELFLSVSFNLDSNSDNILKISIFRPILSKFGFPMFHFGHQMPGSKVRYTTHIENLWIIIFVSICLIEYHQNPVVK